MSKLLNNYLDPADKPRDRFYKMHGSGNDFILMERSAVSLKLDQLPTFAKKICHRHLGVGADGVILISPEKEQAWNYRWDFYNADGSRAELCGNAARCVAWLAVQLNWAKPKHSFLTDVGEIAVEVHEKEDTVTVELPAATQLKTHLKCAVTGTDYTVHFVNTGVPHVVIVVKEVEKINVPIIGEAIRSHPLFAPEGTNVNFVQLLDDHNLLIRSYERGVGETLACGTGAAAAGVIMHVLGLTQKSANIKTSSGETLSVSIHEKSIGLTGSVSFVFSGKINI